eukprot:5735592-Amphidinium_carterae.1
MAHSNGSLSTGITLTLKSWKRLGNCCWDANALLRSVKCFCHDGNRTLSTDRVTTALIPVYSNSGKCVGRCGLARALRLPANSN